MQCSLSPHRLLWCTSTSPQTKIGADSKPHHEHEKHHKCSFPLRALAADARGRESEGEPASLACQTSVDERSPQPKENAFVQEVQEDVWFAVRVGGREPASLRRADSWNLPQVVEPAAINWFRLLQFQLYLRCRRLCPKRFVPHVRPQSSEPRCGG